MIVFEPSKVSKLNLSSINKKLQTLLEEDKANKEVYFYSGDLLKIFLKKSNKEIEQKKFIELIKKIFFLKKTKILTFKMTDEEIYKIITYFQGSYIYYLTNILLSYFFLKKISKNINFIDVFFKEIKKTKTESTIHLIAFIKDYFDDEKDDELFEELVNGFILYKQK